MMYYSAITLLLVFASTSVNGSLVKRGLGELSASSTVPRSVYEPLGHGKFHRRLAAAKPKSDLTARGFGENALLKSKHVLHYVEADHNDAVELAMDEGPAPFAAHVQVDSKLPTFLLEEHDHHFEQVYCTSSTIGLDFYSASTLVAISEQLRDHQEMLIITSHSSCNDAGSRSSYLASDMTVDVKRQSIAFSVEATTWRKHFQSIEVDFGSHPENSKLQRPEHLRKRQIASTSASSTVDFPTTPTATPTSTGIVDASIDKQYIDTSIWPPAFPGSEDLSLHGPKVPANLDLNIKCKNCTLKGNIDITKGWFNVTPVDDDPLIPDSVEIPYDYYENGFVELNASLTAQIELETSIKVAKRLIYNVPLPDIPVGAFEIPEIATIGAIFRPIIAFSATLQKELDFIYGFNLTVPADSSVKFDFKTPNMSTINGFENTAITALPFQSAQGDIELTVSAALSPQLLLTVAFGDVGNVGAGLFLDIPKVSATISQQSHVNEKCEAPQGTNAADQFLFDSLMHIDPSVDLDAGVLADVDVDFKDVYTVAYTTQHTIFNTSFPLPTACLSYDTGANTYGPPSVPASATAAAGKVKGGKGSKSSATPAGASNPFFGALEHLGRLEMTGMVLAVVVGVAMIL